MKAMRGKPKKKPAKIRISVYGGNLTLALSPKRVAEFYKGIRNAHVKPKTKPLKDGRR